MKKLVSANQMRDVLLSNQTSTQPIPFSVVTINAGSSVIQSNPQKGMPMPGSTLGEDAEKQCRELLARRPSYRKLLKELSSSDPDIKSRLVRDAEDAVADHSAANQDLRNNTQSIRPSEDSSGSDGCSDEDSDSRDPRRLDDMGNDQAGSSSSSGHDRLHGQSVHHQNQMASFGFPIQMTNMGDEGASDRYAHQLAMNNSASQPGSGLQHLPGPGQHLAALLPPSSGYQLAPGVIMSGSNQNPISAAMAVMGQGSSPPVGEEVARKREMRLLKNREAARECRRKKKEYVKCLENRVAVLEAQNKALIDELKSLKELYCQASVPTGPGLGSKMSDVS